MKQKTLLLLLPAMISLTSCSSIVSKSDYPVILTSSKPTPIKIKHKKTGEIVHRGTTPTTTTLSASDGYFKSAKYEIITAQSEQDLHATIDPWYAGNIIFGGLIGAVIVDPITGNMWKLPKQVPVATN